jgi:hypothetical protein
MSRHGKLVVASIPTLLCLSFTAANQSTRKLDVLVYSFPGVSSWVLQEAEKEAARLLRPVAVELQWTDCNIQVIDPRCASAPNSKRLDSSLHPQGAATSGYERTRNRWTICRLRYRVYLLRSRAGLANTDEVDACHARTSETLPFAVIYP